jgi:PAS domain S-box-containing protein
MSSVTTQPKTPTPVPAKSDAQLFGQSCGNHRIERRRNSRPGDLPMDVLRRLPALVVLERLPLPTVALTRDGSILFANTAFADMVGSQQEELAGSSFPEIFRTVPAALCALSGVEALTNLILELRHHDGWTVRARMSESALLRSDDPVVLVTFENLTEQLWMNQR